MLETPYLPEVLSLLDLISWRRSCDVLHHMRLLLGLLCVRDLLDRRTIRCIDLRQSGFWLGSIGSLGIACDIHQDSMRTYRYEVKIR